MSQVLAHLLEKDRIWNLTGIEGILLTIVLGLVKQYGILRTAVQKLP
jgi:hypothetical protein